MTKHVGLHFRRSTPTVPSKAPCGTDLPSNSLSRRSPSLIARSNRQSLLSRDETLLARVQRISSCQRDGKGHKSGGKKKKEVAKKKKKKRRRRRRRRRKRRTWKSRSIGNPNVTASREYPEERKEARKKRHKSESLIYRTTWMGLISTSPIASFPLSLSSSTFLSVLKVEQLCTKFGDQVLRCKQFFYIENEKENLYIYTYIGFEMFCEIHFSRLDSRVIIILNDRAYAHASSIDIRLFYAASMDNAFSSIQCHSKRVWYNKCFGGRDSIPDCSREKFFPTGRIIPAGENSPSALFMHTLNSIAVGSKRRFCSMDLKALSPVQ